MNKLDIINEVAKVIGNRRRAQSAVDCIFGSITRALKDKDPVSLTGFGTFKVNKRKARKGRNPRTGEEIQIGERTVPRFLPGKALKEAIGSIFD